MRGSAPTCRVPEYDRFHPFREVTGRVAGRFAVRALPAGILAVACSTEVLTQAGEFRADRLVKQLPKRAWQKVSAGTVAKGHRFYDWAVIDLADPGPGHHQLLIRRNRTTGELAYYRRRYATQATGSAGPTGDAAIKPGPASATTGGKPHSRHEDHDLQLEHQTAMVGVHQLVAPRRGRLVQASTDRRRDTLVEVTFTAPEPGALS